MRSKAFIGSHLYNQIVIPLVVTAVFVAVVATLVAGYFLEELTGQWVSQTADSTTGNIVMRYEEFAFQMQREARLCASDEQLFKALEAEDPGAMRSRMMSQRNALGFDAMTIISAQGAVQAHIGLGEASTVVGSISQDMIRDAQVRPRTVVTAIDGHDAITLLQPIRTGNDRHVLGVTHRIDDELLRSLGVGADRAYCIYSADHRDLACGVGSGFTTAEVDALLTAMDLPAPELQEAVRGAAGGGTVGGSVQIHGTTYEFSVQPVVLPFWESDEPPGYIVGFVSRAVTQQATTTTRNLIAMWSLLAVGCLALLGGWVARRVSKPLVELADGAHRIAAGDFSTKVEVQGANEVARLAQTFNTMTDSLQERSESLTKKVLELATLYEMSRSLGSTLDMDELLDSVLSSVLRIFDLDLGYVVLRDRDSGALTLRAIRGIEESPADGGVRSSMSEWVIREGRPLIFNPDAGSTADQMDSVTGAKAVLCVPLVSAEGAIGSITIGSSLPEYRFTGDDVRLLSTIANHVTIAVGNIELFSSLQEAYLATVRSLAAAVDAKDAYTRGHSDRVASYATMIAESMGLSHDQRIALEMAAYLHDIGKIGVREEILLKPGHLDASEMIEMRHHPLIGANILRPVAFPWAITPVVRHHHEAFDGSGYPAGLRGEEIPLLARILTVADSYEAMTADRPYRVGMTPREAIEELRLCAGAHFDPAVVEVFVRIVEDLEEAGDSSVGVATEGVTPEEARAVFAALVVGVFTSFRRLGGPKLSANVEREFSAFLESEDMPFRMVTGHVSYVREPAPGEQDEIALMRCALRRIDESMGRVSGATLVDHFYVDSLGGFSGRMKRLAEELDFYRTA